MHYEYMKPHGKDIPKKRVNLQFSRNCAPECLYTVRKEVIA